ncbi:MAG: hypothetical protein GF381_03310 [Candidatus Pacebacteria bacterium]|nr:hypothetical protein [Candidatus Paceibacterota bacterium]
MSKYLLLLGTTPKLSLLEAKAVLAGQEVELWDERLLATELESDQQAKQLQQVLGGTVKIFKQITQVEPEIELIEQAVVDYLSQSDERVKFGLISQAQDWKVVGPQPIKTKLKKLGQSSRYLTGGEWGLKAAILSHQPDAIDLVIVKHQEKAHLLKTVSIQEIDDWTLRDRGKPYANRKKGMLPPKIGRIMVNLGLGHLPAAQDKESPILYDPYCGTGTVLIEGLMRGCQVVGSDLDAEAVAGTLENLYWLEKTYQRDFQYQVFQSDVAHADQYNWQTKVDLIVTEPFLGKQTPKTKELDNIFTGLERMHLGAFKTWTQILNYEATVVVIFPKVELSNHTYNLAGLIDKIVKYGYTLEVKPVDYYREKAVVQRQILVFKYKK